MNKRYAITAPLVYNEYDSLEAAQQALAIALNASNPKLQMPAIALMAAPDIGSVREVLTYYHLDAYQIKEVT